MNGGASVACSPASSSISATHGPHIASCRRPRRRPILITAPISISWPAGLRCAFSPIRSPRLSISPMSIAPRPIRSSSRARLGLGEIAPLRSPPEPAPGEATELVRAADMLYAIGETDLVRSFMTDLAQESNDAALLAALGQLTARRNDAQSMLLIGKTALARDLALDHYAFPDIGVPPYSPVGSKLDRCIVYSVVRTESAFDQRDKSSASAVGLMQVTPGAGRDTAKRFGISYDWNRLVSDPAYNTQMGAAELAALLIDYRGSYIMTFAGYNAGRGRVQQWVAQHGDPRDPKVDAVDWVERIPFSETRNYVQRVMENVQVYRARFGASTATVEPNLHRTATIESRAGPISVTTVPQ